MLSPTPVQALGQGPFFRDPALLLQPPALPPALTQPLLPAQPAAVLPVDAPVQVEVEDAAIKKLAPGSELHRKVFELLKAQHKFSSEHMQKHYSRWGWNEQKVQAYTHATDYERLMSELQHKDSQVPEPIQVVVPYTYATIHAAATFVASVLLGRKPVHQLMATRGTLVDNARAMEQALQSGYDTSGGYEALWQMIWDSFIYSFGVTRNSWEEKKGPVINWVNGQRVLGEDTTFAGNIITPIDPYCYFPDPRVPISKCNKQGDFIFTSSKQSKLMDMETAGSLMWVKQAFDGYKAMERESNTSMSKRRIKIGVYGENVVTPAQVSGFGDVHEGTVRLVPKDWGLGSGTTSELWKFAWLGKQIIQAEPLGMIHGEHPYSATEPTSFGHDFMSLSMVDMIGPFQDIISWLVSSRMENVRSTINNQFVADPSRVDVNDIRASAIGRVIRLKQAAIGTPIKDSIEQLRVQDVTTGHISDIQTMRILADTITGVNDNMRGIQTAGGRRSATEARMSMQAGASRLSQHAMRISAQGLGSIASQSIFNIQQFMPAKMWMEVAGLDGQMQSVQATPDMLVGSFNHQVSDGSLPYDKTAMLEEWKEILFGIARDPELRSQYDLGKIFEYVAELGGAKNISSMKRQPMTQASAQANPAADPNMQAIGPAQPAAPLNGSLF